MIYLWTLVLLAWARFGLSIHAYMRAYTHGLSHLGRRNGQTMTGSTRDGKAGRLGGAERGGVANVEICMYVTEGMGKVKQKEKKR